MMTAINNLSPAATTASATTATAPRGELREKFDQFVGQSMFGQMLKSMRQSIGKPAYFHGGRAEEVFQSQLDQLLVEKISDASAEQISEPMYQLFTANLGHRHDSQDLASMTHEQDAQQAMSQLIEAQRSTQSQDNQSQAAGLQRLDLSI